MSDDIFRTNDVVTIARKHNLFYGRILRVTGKAVMVAWKDRYGRLHTSRMVPDNRMRKVPAGQWQGTFED
jgi:hypothetical protein